MKIFISFLLLLSSVIVVVAVDQYFFCPVYSFKSPTPFSGNKIYNPYATAQNGDWIKCNFHAHANCWKGITNGKASAAVVNKVYDGLHYDVHVTSDYQKIDSSQKNCKGYISGYEHGYNILKTHQLVLGASNVCWKDYLLPQTISNKQNILNKLSSPNENDLVVINHPMLRNGYSPHDFTRLTDYSCMEVLNPMCNSSALWDVALSSGKPVFIVGDDDVHNVLDADRVGRMCTWVNVPAINKQNIIHALHTGCSYGMIVGKKSANEIHNGFNAIAALKNFQVNGDTLKAKFSLPAHEISVIGNNGHVLLNAYNADSVTYSLTDNISYARVVAKFDDGTQILLNPVFRYKTAPLQQAAVFVNSTDTFSMRLIGVLILVFWFTLLYNPSLLKKFLPKSFVVNRNSRQKSFSGSQL